MNRKKVNIMRKPGIVAAAVISVFALAAAGAASLTLTGTIPQQGTVDLLCQPTSTPIDVEFEADDLNLSKVILKSVHANCAGKTVEVVLFDEGDPEADIEPAPLATVTATLAQGSNSISVTDTLIEDVFTARVTIADSFAE